MLHVDIFVCAGMIHPSTPLLSTSLVCLVWGLQEEGRVGQLPPPNKSLANIVLLLLLLLLPLIHHHGTSPLRVGEAGVVVTAGKGECVVLPAFWNTDIVIIRVFLH